MKYGLSMSTKKKEQILGGNVAPLLQEQLQRHLKTFLRLYEMRQIVKKKSDIYNYVRLSWGNIKKFSCCCYYSYM